jgi:hypothetical protein
MTHILMLAWRLGDLRRPLAPARRHIAQWRARLFAKSIRVSPMTRTWLRISEAERSKHEPG